MRTPVQFFRDRRVSKVNRIVAEILRVSDVKDGVSRPRNTQQDDVSISTYRRMLGDNEILADLTLKEMLMLPVLNIVPRDGDEKSKKAALFIEKLHDLMPGSPLMFYRDMALREAHVTGFCVGEILFKERKIEGFGKVNAPVTITIGNSEEFVGRTKIDEYGRIEKFVQERDGETPLDPSDVIFYGYRATTGNPEGTSALFPAYPFWKFKAKVNLKLEVFTAVNAAGIIKFKIPPTLWEKEKDDANALLSDLQYDGGLVMPANWDLTHDIPNPAAGAALVNILQQVCDKGMRKAILFDDTVNAEGMHTWGEAGKEETHSMVAEICRVQGEEFCDSFVSDQAFRRILDQNGMQSYPTPIATNSSTRKTGDPIQILDALGRARQSQVITIPIEANEQHQILSQLYDSFGVEYSANEAEDKAEEEPRIQIVASAPRGRMKRDILKTKKKRVEREKKAIGNTVEVWNELTPQISRRLATALFTKEGWKSTNLGSIREATKEAVKYGGKQMREAFQTPMLEELNLGMEEAKKTLKVKALASTAPRVDPRMAVQSLQQRVYLLLEKEYGRMGDDLYFMLENAVRGTTSPMQAQAQIENFLMTNGFQEGRASTVLGTALSVAHNNGRMSVYSELHDPFGQTAGSIKGYEYSAVLDDVTTDLCEALNKEFFRCNDSSLPQPPLHHNCRSLLIPVFDDEEPWNGKSFNDENTTQKIISSNGGIPTGFGG